LGENIMAEPWMKYESKPWEKYQQTEPLPEPVQEKEEPSMFSRIGTNLKNRYNKFINFADYELDKKYRIHEGEAKVTQPKSLTEQEKLIVPKTLPEATRDIASVAANIIPQGVGAVVSDIGGELLSTGLKKGLEYTPKLKSELATTFNILANTKAGKEGLAMISKLNKVTDEWAEQHPGEAMYVSSLLNVVGVTGVKSLLKSTSKTLMKEVDDITANIVKDTSKPWPKIEIPVKEKTYREEVLKGIEGNIIKPKADIDDIIQHGFYKGVRPSVAGKKTFKFMGDYFEDGKNAVTSILKRTDTTPKTLDEFSEAITKSKKAIWDDVKKISKNATLKGVKVDLSRVVKNMEDAAEVYLISPHPAESRRLIDLAENFRKKYPDLRVSPDEAEKMLSEYNAASKAWWKDRNPNDIAVATSNAGIANDLRESLFESIPDVDVYKQLRKEYGSHLAVEKDVAHRAMIHNRRNVKGFFSLVDLWGTGELAAGIATSSPASIVRGASHKILSRAADIKNNPNIYIKRMFNEVEKRMVKSGELPQRNRFIQRERPTGKWTGESDLKPSEARSEPSISGIEQPSKGDISSSRRGKGKGGIISVSEEPTEYGVTLLKQKDVPLKEYKNYISGVSQPSKADMGSLKREKGKGGIVSVKEEPTKVDISSRRLKPNEKKIVNVKANDIVDVEGTKVRFDNFQDYKELGYKLYSWTITGGDKHKYSFSTKEKTLEAVMKEIDRIKKAK
jgi:hypothetical protein